MTRQAVGRADSPRAQASSGPLVSVVLCTRNRARLLERALSTLVVQTLPQYKYEVLVVDNASADATAEVVKRFTKGHPALRYLREETIGLSHARNRGWRTADGTYVAYTDDDCLLPEQWLEVAERTISELRPAVFGGPYFPVYDAAKPSWFRDEYRSSTHGDKAHALCSERLLPGGNLFVRKDLLVALGGFRADFGMSGNRIGYGEESDFQHRLRKTEPDSLLWYEPSLFVYHLVRAERLRWPWLIRQFFSKGRDVYLTRSDHTALTLSRARLAAKMTKVLTAMAADGVIGTLLRSRDQYPHYQNYLYENTSNYLRTLGKLWAQWQRVGTKEGPQ